MYDEDCIRNVLSPFGRFIGESRNWLRTRSRLERRAPVTFTSEVLEERLFFAAGPWSNVNNLSTHGTGTAILLSNGTVMMRMGDNEAGWDQLTPDASGGYANGTWSPLRSMHTKRQWFPANVLRDGRVFVLGGEFSGSTTAVYLNSAEIYDPASNTWTQAAPFPQAGFGDDPSAILPDGQILAGYFAGPQTYIYDPASNTWSQAGTKIHNDPSDEESWLKLPDGSILTYDIRSSIAAGVGEAERFIPSTGQWVATQPLPALLSTDLEIGPALLLPSGDAFFTGSNGKTALYHPATDSWRADFPLPGGYVMGDTPAAMLSNGDALLAADAGPGGPTRIFEFNPNATTAAAAYTDVTPTPGTVHFDFTGNSYVDTMLVLPTGQVLLGGSGQMVLYTPGGAPQASWRPTISGITADSLGVHTLTGTQINGISEGATYGDDAEMSSNYPMVRVVDSATSNVYYATTYGWSSTGVDTGNTPQSVHFILPTALGNDPYQISVIANGIASTTANRPPTVATAAAAGAAGSGGTTLGISVLGDDPDTGESSLSYHWSAIGPAPVTFQSNDSNAAKDSSAVFSRAGAYTFTATISDPGGSSVNSVFSYTVPQIESQVAVTPATATVTDGQTQSLTAQASDQFGHPMSPPPAVTWSVDAGGIGGGIDPTGLYTAPPAGTGNDAVRATDPAAQLSGTAAVAVTTNHAPTIATAPSAGALGGGGTDLGLSVLGADVDTGESSLVYHWSATGPAPVTFASNDDNFSQNNDAIVSKAGAYTFTVTITDPAGLSVMASTSFAVPQFDAHVTIAPSATPTLSGGASQTFVATAFDQFGNALAPQPTFAWAVSPGGVGGQISAAGTYTAPFSDVDGTDTIVATPNDGSLQEASTSVAVLATRPLPPIASIAAPADVIAPVGEGVVSVVYNGQIPITTRTIGIGNLKISGPSGQAAVASVIIAPLPTDPRSVTATYRFTPPGGSWTAADNGAWSVNLNSANPVTDSRGNAATGTAANFSIAIPTMPFGAVAGQKRPVKLSLNQNGVPVTVWLAGGSGAAGLDAAGRITLTLTGGKLSIKALRGRATLGDVIVNGNLTGFNAPQTNVAGTFYVVGNLTRTTLGGVTGTIAASGNISGLNILSLNGARVLAGANLGTDGQFGGSGAAADTFGGGSISNLKVHGSIAQSILAAGIAPGIDGIFGTPDDVAGAAGAGSIQSLTAQSADPTTRFEATSFGLIRLPRRTSTPTDARFVTL